MKDLTICTLMMARLRRSVEAGMLGSRSFVGSVVLLLAAISASSVDAANSKDQDWAPLIVSGLNAVFDNGMVDVRIVRPSDGANEVIVGESVAFEITAVDRRYLLMLITDADGAVSVIFPDWSIRHTPDSYTRFIYPPEGTGEVIQAPPEGGMVVVALATNKQITANSLGFADDSDFYEIGSDDLAIGQFLARLNSQLEKSTTDATVLNYSVQPPLQYGVRGVRREIEKRVDEVDILAKQNEQTETNSASAKDKTACPVVSESALRSEALSVHDIQFYHDSINLTVRGRLQLDKFGQVLQELFVERPCISIALEGHTDDTGSSAYNQNLSLKRAIEARRFLVVNFGLVEDRILVRGKGEAEPLTANVDYQSRALNRRVEVSLQRGAE